ncbi:isochorismatase family protein [Paenibacillus sp. PvR148]
MDAMKEWMRMIPEAEQVTYKQAGFLTGLELGKKAALVVVDVTYGFTGSESVSLQEAILEYPTACGPAAWEAMPRISRLIELFRSKQLPIVYTHSDSNSTHYTGKATKSKRTSHTAPGFNDFPEPVAPKEGEWVLGKTKASIFFQTPLSAYLVKEKVDTLVLCGVSTSGCVRASAVDACSHGYTTFVIDDCCFDRSYFSHCSNLFDMNAKYASVISLHELEELMV